MEDLTVSLPEPLKQFVEAEAAARGFASPREYVQDMLCRAYRDKTRKELESKLLQRLQEMEQGQVEDMTPEDWAEIRDEVEQFYKEREAG